MVTWNKSVAIYFKNVGKISPKWNIKLKHVFPKSAAKLTISPYSSISRELQNQSTNYRNLNSKGSNGFLKSSFERGKLHDSYDSG